MGKYCLAVSLLQQVECACAPCMHSPLLFLQTVAIQRKLVLKKAIPEGYLYMYQQNLILWP